MRNLTPFEFTPNLQPVEEDPVIFTLRPLDFRGSSELMAAQAMAAEGIPSLQRITARFIHGWRGGGQDPVASRGAAKARLDQVLAGEPMITWTCWLLEIANELLEKAKPSEEDAKKF